MFISLEGSEGAGKSTLIASLKEFFKKNKIEFLFTREPGATKEGQILREILLDKSIEIDPYTETFLLMADRLQHANKIVMPALTQDINVLSDRYVDSTYAYQGAGRGISQKYLDQIIEPLNLPMPELTIYLDLPVEEGLKRAKHRDELDRFEEEDIKFFERIRSYYSEQAKINPNRFFIIDSSKDKEEVFEISKNIILKKLNEK
tara:strand:- start:6809 stop:7420 length:612 start_codon:yes stop_codon:yes gene_type:complete